MGKHGLQGVRNAGIASIATHGVRRHRQRASQLRGGGANLRSRSLMKNARDGVRRGAGEATGCEPGITQSYEDVSVADHLASEQLYLDEYSYEGGANPRSNRSGAVLNGPTVFY
jgi:hypothetical protein